MDPKRFEECVFYLNMYGSYSGVVTFYVNHNHLKLACRFILEKVLLISLNCEGPRPLAC